ncbi:DUF11 domain-containing protein [Streptomyces sp. N35]|uniref:DUF11 domain-containing protein n=1 Tax=Streptomyces sp. N35 TaxID=2795730 RepID=UPI001F22A227|nr:DUF11 domain-containing protein [Streptomyces sp. N35]
MGRARRRTLGALVATATAATSLAGLAPAAAVVVEPFAKRYDEAVYGDFITLGNAVLDCPSTPPDEATRCRTAQSGASGENNNQFTMQYTDTAGFSTSVLNSSTGQVRIPPGAKVAYARLFWGGNDGTYKLGRNQIKFCDTAGAATLPAGDPLTTAPLIRVGTGAEAPVTVQNAVKTPADTGGPHYYTAEADVTSSFAGAATGVNLPVAVGNVWAPTGKGCVGGWSLTVVYQYDAPNAQYAPERRNVYIYGGHVVQRSADPDTTITVDGFLRAGTKDVRASVTAYEGDSNVAGDAFLVNGTNIAEPGSGATTNFFNSHADGCLNPCDNNNFSIDAKQFTIPDRVIPEGATSAKLTFRTKGDTYVPSALAFSVPVPDLSITKTAAPAKVQPGSKVTYTVTAKNIGSLDYPGAKFADDLSDLLDDATYNNDAKATVGTVSYAEPKISWVGDVPEGQTATITYSVTVNDPLSGDGKLTNNVIAETPRTNCEDGSTDPACGFTPVIEEPQPPKPPVPPLEIVTKPTPPVVPPCADTTNTITLTNATATVRKAARIHWPVVAGGTPKASSGTVVKSGKNWVWTGDVPAKGKVVIKQTVKASCTPGGVVVIPVTGDVPKTTCTPAKTRAGGTDPCVSVIVSKRTQARPAPPELAETGGGSNGMLYGGLAIVMCGLGALALAASRSRRD